MAYPPAEPAATAPMKLAGDCGSSRISGILRAATQELTRDDVSPSPLHRRRRRTTATHRPASTAPDLTYPNGGTADYLATGAQTDGLFGLYRWEEP